jgi:hypothetical protein
MTTGQRGGARHVLAQFKREPLGLRFISEEIERGATHVLVVGRVAELRSGAAPCEFPVALLWEFEAGVPSGISQFASKEHALAAL